MWVEIVLVVLAVSVAYWALGLHDTPANPESPETDGESIDEFFQVVGAAMTFAVAVTFVAAFEMIWMIIGARRRAQSCRVVLTDGPAGLVSERLRPTYAAVEPTRRRRARSRQTCGASHGVGPPGHAAVG